MSDTEKNGKGAGVLLRTLCFMMIGICAFSDPVDLFNPYRIGFGIITGSLFGFLFRIFLRAFLNLLNGKLKRELGKAAIKSAVDRGMLFLIPFVVMLIIAAFLLEWSMTAAFISAGIMAVGTAAAIEMGKLKGKQEIRNTIATSGVSYLFTFLWTLSFPFLVKIPPLMEGGIGLLKQFLSGGGGVL